MTLTSDNKVRLATELCGLKPQDGNYYTVIGELWGAVKDFDPVNNWNHMRLVLGALEKKREGEMWRDVDIHISSDKRHVGLIVASKVYKHDSQSVQVTGETLGDAVCAAGLEIIGKDGA